VTAHDSFHGLPLDRLAGYTVVDDDDDDPVLLNDDGEPAGKGGTIKRFMEHLNPRGARVVALEKPTERESSKDAELVAKPDPLLVGRASQLFEEGEGPVGPFPQL